MLTKRQEAAVEDVLAKGRAMAEKAEAHARKLVERYGKEYALEHALAANVYISDLPGDERYHWVLVVGMLQEWTD